MARVKKRKNAGVGIDFRRAKRKVGRALPKAANRTDTTIRTRSIHVPGQSVAADRQGAAVSKRQLSLKELLQQTRHYGSKVRREAWTGLGELFSEYPAELTAHLNRVLHAMSEGMVDSEGYVRSACYKLMANVVLPTVSTDALRPFLPILMSHICCALTGLDTELRQDGLKFLQLMVHFCGGLMSDAHFEACLKQFVHLLGNTQLFRKLESQSQATLHQILSVLNELLRGVPVADSNPNGHSDQPLNSQSHAVPLFSAQGVVESGKSDVTVQLVALLQNVRNIFDASLLLMETAEGTLSMQNVVASVTALLGIAERLLETDKAVILPTLKGVCSKLEEQFPWVADVTDSTEKCQLIGAFNLKSAHLLVLSMGFVDSAIPCPFQQGLLKFYSGMMDEEIGDATSAHCEAVTWLLPQIRLLLETLNEPDQQFITSKLIQCCDAFVKRPKSQLLCLQFLLETLKTQFSHLDRSTHMVSNVMMDVIIGSLPKWIWSTGSKSLDNTQVCLQILHLLVTTADASLTESLIKRLPEFLLLMLARVRVHTTGLWTDEICHSYTDSLWPLMKCPLETQLLFLDCLFYWPVSHQSLLDLPTLVFIFREAAFSAGFLSRLFLVLAHRLKDTSLSERTLTDLKFLIRALLGDMTGQGKDPKRDEVLVSAAIHLTLSLIPDPATFALELMECPLLKTSHSCGVLCLGSHVFSATKLRLEPAQQQLYEQTLAQILSTYMFHSLQPPHSTAQATGSHSAELDSWKFGSSLEPLVSICAKTPSLLPSLLHSIKAQLVHATPEAAHRATQSLLAMLEAKSLSKHWPDIRAEVLKLKRALDERIGQDTAMAYRLSATVQHLFP